MSSSWIILWASCHRFPPNVSFGVWWPPLIRKDFDVLRLRSIWINRAKVKHTNQTRCCETEIRQKRTNWENVRRTLVIMFFLGYGVGLPPWLTFSPARPLFGWLRRLRLQLSLRLDQQGRLPFDWVAQMHGQTLVLPLVVTNQIVNSLKKRLVQTSRCLMKQEQHKVNNKGPSSSKNQPSNHSYKTSCLKIKCKIYYRVFKQLLISHGEMTLEHLSKKTCFFGFYFEFRLEIVTRGVGVKLGCSF